MTTRKPMLTMSQVMTKLAKKGIVNEFSMNEEGRMKFGEDGEFLNPEDLKILRSYRFEGDSNPDDNAVLYVLQDKNANKGMIIDSYGANSNYYNKFDDFIRNIPVEEAEELNFETDEEVEE